MTAEKILSLDGLAVAVAEHKAHGRTVVQCHGVFDLMHPGHIRHFENARREGDVLVVTVTPDRYVNKGPGRPVFDDRLRAESIAALACVDHVAVNDRPTAVEAIRLLQPDVYAKGDEYQARDEDVTGAIFEEEGAVLESGGRMHFTGDVTFSSSALLNKHFDVFSPEARVFLDDFRVRYSAGDVIRTLKALSSLRVVVVGELIVDEYCFCRAYGLASKASTIAVQQQHVERYAGGAAAVANHLAGFCGTVDLVTSIGAEDSHEEFLRARLKPNVDARFHVRAGSPTTVKRRYVHEFLATKLFEVSQIDDEPPPPDLEASIRGDLRRCVSDADLVISADFGQGLVSPSIVETLTLEARFLAVTAKTNAMNVGYNAVTRYPRADYVCVNAEEARLAYGDRRAAFEEVAGSLADTMQAHAVAITRRQHGSVVRGAHGEVVSAPAFTREVVDPVGAGDAFLALTAPLAHAGASADLIAFVGNAAGALAVRVVGNKEPVEPVPLFQFVSTLLK